MRQHYAPSVELFMWLWGCLLSRVRSCHKTDPWITVEKTLVLKCVLGLGCIPGGEGFLSLYTAPLLSTHYVSSPATIRGVKKKVPRQEYVPQVCCQTSGLLIQNRCNLNIVNSWDLWNMSPYSRRTSIFCICKDKRNRIRNPRICKRFKILSGIIINFIVLILVMMMIFIPFLFMVPFILSGMVHFSPCCLTVTSLLRCVVSGPGLQPEYHWYSQNSTSFGKMSTGPCGQ